MDLIDKDVSRQTKGVQFVVLNSTAGTDSNRQQQTATAVRNFERLERKLK